MLRYLGHESTSILDGGIQAWNSAGLPLSQEMPSEREGSFQPIPRSDWIVDIETVKAQKNLPSVAVVDSRSPERWRGEVEPIDPIAGSVPGSVNSFWQNVSTEAGELESREALADYWSRIDLQPETIVYCGSGVTACVNLFSLVMAGYSMPKLYPGGWSDWCSYLIENRLMQTDCIFYSLFQTAPDILVGLISMPTDQAYKFCSAETIVVY